MKAEAGRSLELTDKAGPTELVSSRFNEDNYLKKEGGEQRRRAISGLQMCEPTHTTPTHTPNTHTQRERDAERQRHREFNKYLKEFLLFSAF